MHALSWRQWAHKYDESVIRDACYEGNEWNPWHDWHDGNGVGAQHLPVPKPLPPDNYGRHEGQSNWGCGQMLRPAWCTTNHTRRTGSGVAGKCYDLAVSDEEGVAFARYSAGALVSLALVSP